MALNQLMHPRNPYRDRRPDFKALAEQYDQFREHTTSDAKGKVYVDFKNPASLRALTWALLQSDFGLNVTMPLDRLIPTVPLRLNYILWLEDIFGSLSKTTLRGIDIGTGTSCIYPLLAARLNGWQFMATDADATNVAYAVENVTQNNLTDKIRVIQVGEECTLADSLRCTDDTFDFCMCNPPFYGSNLEAWGWLTSRSQQDRMRPEPSSVSTASPVESIAPGGEVQFIRQRIIESSLELKSRVRVYSTMLGKKTSVSAVKEILRIKGITNIGTTEFCQGKTMRWGIAWSFDTTIRFPKAISKVLKNPKPKPPSTYTLPQKYDSVSAVAQMLEAMFTELNVNFKLTCPVAEADKRRWHIECLSNTWTHQRRKRREMRRAQQQQQPQSQNSSEDVSFNSETSEGSETTPRKRRRDGDFDDEDSDEVLNKRPRLDTSDTMNTSDMDCMDGGDSMPKCDTAILCCNVELRKLDSSVVMEMHWVSGENKELLHQLLQYFKNQFV